MLEIGLFAEALIPALLIFTVMFVLMQKTKVLGGMQTPLNAFTSLAFAAIITLPHVWQMYPAEVDPVILINASISIMSFVIVSLAGILLLITHLDVEGIDYGFGRVDWIIIIMTVAFLLMLGWVKFVDIFVIILTLAAVIYAALYQKSRITEYHFMPPWIGIIIFLAAFYSFAVIMGWTSYLPPMLIWLDYSVVQIMLVFALSALGEIGFISYFR